MNNRIDVFLGNKWRHLAVYTCLFLVTFSSCYIWFGIDQKSFIWEFDGAWQHYLAFVYIGKWLRAIAKTLIATGALSVPLFDPTIGYGTDVISTFSYYGLGEPLVWLSALCPVRYAEFLYGVLIVVRLFLAGLAFLAFTRYLKLNNTASTIASIAYVFSYWGLYAGVRHPFFLVPLIFLPLCLLGTEKIFRGEKPTVFIVSTFVAALCSFYFFYMLFVAIFFYALVRFFATKHESTLKEFVSLFFKFLLYGIVAFLMAGILMEPVLGTLLSSSRSGADILLPVYSANYYEKLFTCAIFAPTSPGNWALIGVTPTVAIGSILLFANRGNKIAKILIVTMMVCLAIPAAGSFLNGMSFSSNRWSWMLVFALCIAFPLAWKYLINLDRKNTIVLLVFVSADIILIHYFGLDENQAVFTALCVLVFSVMTLLAHSFFQNKARKGPSGKPFDVNGLQSRQRHYKPIAMTCLILAMAAPFIGCALNAYSLFKTNAYTAQFVDKGNAASFTTSNDAKLARQLSDKSGVFCRLEGTDINYNIAMQSRMPSTGFYWSLCDSTISDYLIDMSVNEVRSFAYYGTNQRTFLDELASVGFYSGPKENTPYNYEQITNSLAKNRDVLPLGYTYETSLTSKEYKSLNSLQKQEALLQNVVFDDDESGTPHGTTESELKSQPVEIDSLSGAKRISGNKFVVGESGATLTLNTNLPCDEESYLYVKNVTMEAKTLYGLYHDGDENYLSETDYGKLSSSEKRKLKKAYENDSPSRVDQFRLNVSCGDIKSYLQYWSPYSSHYAGQSDFVVCLGTDDKERKEVTITFPTPGIYDLGDLCMFSQPMGDYPQYVKERKRYSMQNTCFGTNKVTGSINLPDSRALLISLPYSDAWKAKVDGTDVTLHKANGMFMAVSLGPGEHSIELTYQTKWLVPGVLSSVLGLILFGAITIRKRRISKGKHARSK